MKRTLAAIFLALILALAVLPSAVLASSVSVDPGTEEDAPGFIYDDPEPAENPATGDASSLLGLAALSSAALASAGVLLKKKNA